MSITQEQKQQLIQQMAARERELWADIQREKGLEPDYAQVAGEVGDPGDNALADLLRDMSHADIGRDVNELRELADAQRRIHGEDYGYCVDCGVDIPFERLKIQPTATRCVECQTRFEQTHNKQPRTGSL